MPMRSNIWIHNLVGESPWTVKVRQLILEVSGYSYGVLITGPSRTGKELIARDPHPRSASRQAVHPGQLRGPARRVVL